MNSFADNPLFFLLDKMPPIISVKNPKSGRKIVELLDTGCDAKLPMPNLDRPNSLKFSETKSNEGWKTQCEEKINNSYGSRFQLRNKRSAINIEDCYDNQNDDMNQCYWQKQPQHEHVVGNKQFQRNLLLQNGQTAPRMPSPKMRSQHWRQMNNSDEINSSTLYNKYNVAAKSVLQKTNLPIKQLLHGNMSRKPRISTIDPKLVETNRKPGHKNHEQEIESNEEKQFHVELDYPENYETTESLQNSWRNYKSGNQQEKNVHSCNDTKNPVENMSLKSSRYTKYSPKNLRPTGSAKSSDLSKSWNSSTNTKPRPRTHSPMMYRRKTEQSSKSLSDHPNEARNRNNTEVKQDFEYTEKNGYPQDENINSVSKHSVKKEKEFTDRGVDNITICEKSNASTSVDYILNSSIMADIPRNHEEQRKVKASYGDFIPFNNDFIVKQVLPDYYDHPSMRISDDLNTRKYLSQNDRRQLNTLSTDQFVVNEDRLENIDTSYGDLFYKHLLYPSNTNLNVSLENSNSSLFNFTKSLSNMDHVFHDKKPDCRLKDESKINNNHLSSSFKKPNYCAKLETNDDKQKKIDNGVFEPSYRQNAKGNILERTAASLKRKLDKSRIAEFSRTSNQPSGNATEKKVKPEVSAHSKLPIRIGSHRKPKDPVVTKYRFNAKTNSAGEANKKSEVKKELKDNSAEPISSLRSRTKPKQRSSIFHNTIIANPTEDLKHSKSKGDVQKRDEGNDYIEQEYIKKLKLLDNYVDNTLMSSIDVNVYSAMTKFLYDEKSEDNVQEQEMEDLTSNEVDDERRNQVIHSCDDEMTGKYNFEERAVDGTSKNSFNDKCCFHLNVAEDMVCNNNYNKYCKNLRPSRKKKQFAIKLGIFHMNF